MRLQRRVDVVHQADVDGVIQAFLRLNEAIFDQQLFNTLVSAFGQEGLARLLIQRIITGTVFLFLLDQLRHQHLDFLVEIAPILGGARDNQRRPRFVDKDGVHFVDNGEKLLALNPLIQAECHVVAQIIEAEFVVGAIGDIGGIGFATLLGR